MAKFEYIIKAIEKSYSHSPHLQEIAGNLNSKDPEILQKRYDELSKAISTSEEYFTTKNGKPKVKRDEWEQKERVKLDKKIMKEYKEQNKEIIDKLKDTLDNIEEELSQVKSVEFMGHTIALSKSDSKRDNPYKEYSRDWRVWDNYNTLFKEINDIRDTIDKLENGKDMGGSMIITRKTSKYDYIKNCMSFLKGWNNKSMDYPKEGTFIELPETYHTIHSYINDISTKYVNECYKIDYEYDRLRAIEDIKLRDYEYERYRLKKYCEYNNIKIKT